MRSPSPLLARVTTDSPLRGPPSERPPPSTVGAASTDQGTRREPPREDHLPEERPSAQEGRVPSRAGGWSEASFTALPRNREALRDRRQPPRGDRHDEGGETISRPQSAQAPCAGDLPNVTPSPHLPDRHRGDRPERGNESSLRGDRARASRSVAEGSSPRLTRPGPCSHLCCLFFSPTLV